MKGHALGEYAPELYGVKVISDTTLNPIIFKVKLVRFDVRRFLQLNANSSFEHSLYRSPSSNWRFSCTLAERMNVRTFVCLFFLGGVRNGGHSCSG